MRPTLKFFLPALAASADARRMREQLEQKLLHPGQRPDVQRSPHRTPRAAR